MKKRIRETSVCHVCEVNFYGAGAYCIDHRQPQPKVTPKVEHTPTPWELNDDGLTIGNIVAKCKLPEDAAFIVRAVNSVERLEEANVKLVLENRRLKDCHEELLAEVKYLETLASGWPAKDRNRLTGLIAKARGK